MLAMSRFQQSILHQLGQDLNDLTDKASTSFIVIETHSLVVTCCDIDLCVFDCN